MFLITRKKQYHPKVIVKDHFPASILLIQLQQFPAEILFHDIARSFAEFRKKLTMLPGSFAEPRLGKVQDEILCRLREIIPRVLPLEVNSETFY